MDVPMQLQAGVIRGTNCAADATKGPIEGPWEAQRWRMMKMELRCEWRQRQQHRQKSRWLPPWPVVGGYIS
jgi:hypothetical protein